MMKFDLIGGELKLRTDRGCRKHDETLEWILTKLKRIKIGVFHLDTHPHLLPDQLTEISVASPAHFTVDLIAEN